MVPKGPPVLVFTSYVPAACHLFKRERTPQVQIADPLTRYETLPAAKGRNLEYHDGLMTSKKPARRAYLREAHDDRGNVLFCARHSLKSAGTP